MREWLGTRDVIGRRAGSLGDVEDLFGRRQQELRFGIDESAYQPGAGDTVDLGPLAGDPSLRARWGLPAAAPAKFGPTRNLAIQVDRIDVDGAKRCGCALADLLAVDAVDDDRTIARQLSLPGGHAVRIVSDRADDRRLVRIERGCPAHIEQDRRCRRPDADV